MGLELAVTWHPNGLSLHSALYTLGSRDPRPLRLPASWGIDVLERSVVCETKTKRHSELSKLSSFERLMPQGNSFYKKHYTRPGFTVCLACCFKSLTVKCERYSVSVKQWHDKLKQNLSEKTLSNWPANKMPLWMILLIRFQITMWSCLLKIALNRGNLH